MVSGQNKGDSVEEQNNRVLPLAGLKVVEVSHMVMGPSVGVILGDLGAEVLKIEPIGGDNTRQLTGAGAGYFAMYCRNKKSLCLDLKSVEGIGIAKKLIKQADIFLENFRPNAMEKLGLGYQELKAINPRLIYCSLKGFLNGPYENRTALDEVAQMMGGLAYMTGLPGKPMRAGASVIDVCGGMFGVIAILSALEERHRTGEGQLVVSSLFETAAFLVGQHMAQQVATGEPVLPMSQRRSAWAVYDIFENHSGEPIFIGVVSDTQWQSLCRVFRLDSFAKDPSLAKNGGRVEQRERVIPVLQLLFRSMPTDLLIEMLDKCGLPYSPVNKPADLFEDYHLNNSGGLLALTLTDGKNKGETALLPALPISMQGRRLGVVNDIPKKAEHSRETLSKAGFSRAQIEYLIDEKVIEDC